MNKLLRRAFNFLITRAKFLIIAPLMLMSSMASGTAVIDLGDTFIIIPTSSSSTYVGSANLQFTTPLGVQNGTRALTIEISNSGSVTVTGPDNSVSGSLSGNTVSANIPVNVSEGGFTCSGSVFLTGNVGSNQIIGTVNGTVPCVPNLFSVPVTGTFTATKT